MLADSAYLRRAFALLVQHLGDRTLAPTVIRLEVTAPMVTVHLPTVDPDLADPLARLDQVIRSTDPARSKQAVVWLRLALSRAFIEIQGGQWLLADQTVDPPALIVTLPGVPSEPNSGGQ